jgi:hypothetical protein
MRATGRTSNLAGGDLALVELLAARKLNRLSVMFSLSQ